jgi:hypothetical protein
MGSYFWYIYTPFEPSKMKRVLLLFTLFSAPFVAQCQELVIYTMRSFGAPEAEMGFVSLSDSYTYSEHPDSLAIPDEHLGELDLDLDPVHHHVLKGKYRSRFLQNVGISEQDKIFIYSPNRDTVIRFKVKDIPLIARITIYGANLPVSQYDYQVGFEIIPSKLPSEVWNQYYKTYVFVGKTNPFVLGQLQPMLFEPIDPQLFPPNYPIAEVSTFELQSLEKRVYRFSMGGLEYLVCAYGHAVLHLVVLNATNKNLVYEAVYYDSESSSPAPLSIRNDTANTENEQWTGRLFKDKPPVVMGFMYHSFGCESIDFLDPFIDPIYVRCDNRH